MPVYRQEDYADISAQLKKRWIAVATPAALLLVCVGISFGLRWPQTVTALLTIAAIFLFIFCFAMFISPVIAYRRHIDHALHGKTHDTEGVFVEMEPDAVVREGLRLYPMTINVGAGIRDDGDRLFYFDANLPLPAWQIGESITVTAHDKAIGAWNRA